jgi:hypothetical protein
LIQIPRPGTINVIRDSAFEMACGKLCFVFKIMGSLFFLVFSSISLQDRTRCNWGLIGDGFIFYDNVYDPDFPGETFRVLKEKEEREYGEYRTRRLVLEAWDAMERDIYR